MKEILAHLKKTDSLAIFHDTRGEAKVMAKAVNLIIDKVNELVRDVNEIKEIIGKESDK